MANNIDFKKLTEEDVPEESRPLLRAIAGSYNDFGEQLIQALAGRLDFNNLAQELRDIEVEVGSNGVPITQSAFKLTKISRVNGISCIRAINRTSPGVYPSGSPFVSFALDGDIVKIQHISNIQANNKYSLKLLLF